MLVCEKGAMVCDVCVSELLVTRGPLCVSRSGLVESKIRILVSKLEFNDGIELAHVYPTSYGPPPGDK